MKIFIVFILIKFDEENQEKKMFRVQLSKKVGDTIRLAFSLLGIQVPDRM
jgi:arginyl-tRNA synthetase